MGLPLQMVLSLGRYLVTRKLKNDGRFPLVVMLEPTHRCNLSCVGCGRIREYRDTLDQVLTVDECLASTEEAGAPIVAVSGGEPLLHPKIDEIVAGILSQGRFVTLCTNGLLLEESLQKFTASTAFSFSVHVDGLAETHDRLAGRSGTFASAMRAIGTAKKKGFRVLTNTTVYNDTSPAEITQLLALLMERDVDGVLLSPGYGFEAVEAEIFLDADQIDDRFREILSANHKVRFYNTPLYLQFLRGQMDLSCTPWGNPTRTPQGWKRPCYLLTDGYCDSHLELMEETNWERYGPGRDPRCANCRVHSGFETSAILEMSKPATLLKTIWGRVLS